MDAIVIEGLNVNTVIGCFDWERQIEQPLSIDLTLNTSLARVAESDLLADTLNYVEICEITAQTIQQAQPKMLEHAAKLVIDALFTTFSTVESIIMVVRKPAILPQANSVGIRLERHRNDIRARASE
ncbi:dihydroneopterin aldolase [Acinetobacter larvae]|uniref:7,8-dihydroneopterin aldolase n=1 Tax=Acinetobacter larvae TaxID=1789224 RepID=A0A1B2M058_9GAMM|nr:dihydroneopterin aldolase [Acinetobacter larvae]AOA58584.1 dihydroneopterin aldolase [Acinetobacter larvae]